MLPKAVTIKSGPPVIVSQTQTKGAEGGGGVVQQGLEPWSVACRATVLPVELQAPVPPQVVGCGRCAAGGEL